MKCNCTVAYNGYTDFVDAEVYKSGIEDAVLSIKEDKADWIKNGKGRTDSIYKKVCEFYENASDKEFLEESYKTANYCPRCGEKIDWSKYE